uniref:Uncharacterized protein n=1 Tax=Rhizophagus irregularis (strain DAOM 181602 / DAOM 197198 / MUCL 43194) TaxID=747089 RepID=U9UAP7_RHIID
MLLKELTEATTVHSISRCELMVDDSLESSTQHFGSSVFVWRDTLTELVSDTLTQKPREN